MKRLIISFLAAGIGILSFPAASFGMHIMEGFLPIGWAAFWWIVSLPFIYRGLKNIKKITTEDMGIKMLLAFCGAFTFVLSALKIPSVTGSCSHPTGVGLGAILFGPTVMTVLGLIVLIFQALLLAHGGLTTLGANTFSMAIFGPFIVYYVYKGGRSLGISRRGAIFLAATLGNLATYFMTSIQLAVAYPSGSGGITGSLIKFSSIFAVTQIPLSIVEGLLTVIALNFLFSYNREEIKGLLSIKGG